MSKTATEAHLFFLTLRGEASQDPAVASVKNLSYEKDILPWLLECRKEASSVPVVRETITQYIHLIRQLTGQNINTRMNEKLCKSVLQSEATFQAYSSLCRADSQISITVLRKLKSHLQAFAAENDLVLCFPDTDLSGQYDGFYMTSPDLENHEARITFQFQSKERRALLFGFSRPKAVHEHPENSKLVDLFKQNFNMQKPNAWWFARSNQISHTDWDHAGLQAIQFGGMAQEILEICKKLLEVFNLVRKANAPEMARRHR